MNVITIQRCAASCINDNMAAKDVVVTGLNVFPVKSCRAVSAEEVEIDEFGVVGDRRFMVIDGTRFTSQRRLPRLALITVRYEDGAQAARSRKTKLIFTAPEMPEFILEPELEGERVEVTLWDDTIHVIDQGDAIAKWLNQFVGMGSAHLRLVASAEQHADYSRPLSEQRIPAKLQEKLSDRQVALPDTGPISLVSQESLVDLNRHMKERGGEEVDLKQFRMNIEVSGCSEAYEEDKWLMVQIGTATFLSYTTLKVYRNMCYYSGTSE